VKAKLMPEQEGADADRSPLELPRVDGQCWTSDRLAISREWIAFKEVTGKVPWNVIRYAAVLSVRPAAFSGMAVSRTDGIGVVIGETVLGSLEACSLLVAGMSTNPAVASAASDLLRPYLEAARLERDSSLALRHTVDRSGTTHTFCFHRGRHLIAGIVCVVFGAAFLAMEVADPRGRGAWRDVVLVIFGLALVWMGIRQFRVGVQISGAKLTIRNDYRTRTVVASEIRAITLEPYAFGEVAKCWVPRVELTDGSSVWIDNFDCGPARRPPRPELAATVDEVRMLLWVRADDVSTPESRQPGGAASE
jgi:hypothetical protein